MNSSLPPTLQRKLRGYRFGWWSLAVAETICVGALLVAAAGPHWTPLALLWLGWKMLRRPDNRRVAAAVEARHPELREKLVAAVELAESSDPPSIKGSADLVQALLQEVDRLVQPIDFSRILSVRPVITLMVAAVVVNLALAHYRGLITRPTAGGPRAGQPLPEGGSVTAAPPAVATAADRLARLEKLAADLSNLPEDTRQPLPPYARSLDSAAELARKAGAAESAREFEEARSLSDAAAENLSEFARLAKQIPGLARLAAVAEALAGEFARSAVQMAMLKPGPPALSEAATTTVAVAEIRGATAVLPATVPSGSPWASPVQKATDLGGAGLGQYPPQYQQPIHDYFERIASAAR